MRTGLVALTVMAAFVAVVAADAAPKRSAPTRQPKSAKAGISKYSLAMIRQQAAVQSCADLKIASSSVLSADFLELGVEDSTKHRFGGDALEKGEYETTDSYLKRVDDTLFYFFGHRDRVVFKAPLPDRFMNYNADRGELTVKIFSHASYEPLPDRPVIPVTVVDSSKKIGRYHGVTRMGIKFDYDAVVHYQRTIKFVMAYSDALKSELVIPVAPAKARGLKDDLYLISFGSIADPYKESSEDETVASLDDPVDQTELADDFTTEPACLYLVRGSTGEILQTYLEPGAGTGVAGNVGHSASGSSRIVWAMYPTADQLASYFPDHAKQDEVEGSATIECRVESAKGFLKCSVLSENPPGYGFGAAAVGLFEKFAAADNEANGFAVGAIVKQTVRFGL